MKYYINYSLTGGSTESRNTILASRGGAALEDIDNPKHFTNALYYIGFCVNFNIKDTIRDVAKYLAKNFEKERRMRKNQYVYFSCSKDYIENICKANEDDNINFQLIQKFSILFNVNPASFKNEIKKLAGNCIVTIYGHGSNISKGIFMNSNCGQGYIGVEGCGTMNQSDVIIADDINEIGNNNPEKYILILFISCFATLLNETITAKNIITLTPKLCGTYSINYIRETFPEKILLLSDMNFDGVYQITNKTGKENYCFYPDYTLGEKKFKLHASSDDSDNEYEYEEEE